MAIVPFPGTDWTHDERAEIRRLEQVCDASEDWSLECSHTDAGDPWCVVYDRHQERIILQNGKSPLPGGQARRNKLLVSRGARRPLFRRSQFHCERGADFALAAPSIRQSQPPARFGPGFVPAANETEFTFSAPDPDPKYVKPPRPGQSYACDPLAGGNVTDDRLAHNARVWVSQSSASKVAVRVSDDGKQLLLMRAMDVSAGVTDPEEFKITSSGSSYLMAEERLILGVALLIMDVRTMKMVWSFNGQGMLGIKGETVLFQCH